MIPFSTLDLASINQGQIPREMLFIAAYRWHKMLKIGDTIVFEWRTPQHA